PQAGIQLILGALALDELTELASHRRQRFHQRLVRFPAFAREELHYADGLAGEDNGKSEGALEAGGYSQRSAWKVTIRRDVVDPGRPPGFPDPSRKAAALGEHAPAGVFLEFGLRG